MSSSSFVENFLENGLFQISLYSFILTLTALFLAAALLPNRKEDLKFRQVQQMASKTPN